MKVTNLFEQMEENVMESIEEAMMETRSIYGIITRIIKTLGIKKFKTTKNNDCISAFVKEGFIVFGKDYQNNWVIRYHKDYKSPAHVAVVEL